MFDRVRIKETAKSVLRNGYWMAVLVAVIVGLLGGTLANGLTGGGSISLNSDLFNYTSDMDVDTQYDDDWVTDTNPWTDQGGYGYDGYPYDENYGYSDESLEGIWSEFQAEWNAIMGEFAAELGLPDARAGVTVFLAVILGILAIIVVAAVLFTVLVGNVMTVGGHGWMLRRWRGENVSVGDAFAAFRIYKPTVVTMLLRSVLVWLWSLLFIIPGIVMGYAYSMAPYIIYENPNLTAGQAIKMSKKMTDGYKADLFVLNLSFIGWKLLVGLTGGLVGIFWANPYMGLTHAGAYEDLKWKAIQSGKLTWADFDQVPPPPADTFESAPPSAWGTPAPQQSWDTAATQQPWGAPAPQQPQQPVWGTPPTAPPAPPQTTDTWNNPTDVRW